MVRMKMSPKLLRLAVVHLCLVCPIEPGIIQYYNPSQLSADGYMTGGRPLVIKCNADIIHMDAKHQIFGIYEINWAKDEKSEKTVVFYFVLPIGVSRKLMEISIIPPPPLLGPPGPPEEEDEDEDESSDILFILLVALPVAAAAGAAAFMLYKRGMFDSFLKRSSATSGSKGGKSSVEIPDDNEPAETHSEGNDEAEYDDVEPSVSVYM
ncbi:hypothetical protein ElyMa_003003800 [Elysia marginata]|uniref:Ig-like domain-containing protein n=1 Tax=Elysia marginata TaxID=1093978 RepID=A0AAV4IDR1_9GAST|nr:hypothetical protein ElyMa_003003800 [Elysia marginata]